MNRYQWAIIIMAFVLFIGINVTPSTGDILVNKPSTINSNGTIFYVGGLEPGNYSTIQSAIDAANPGNTVFVYDESSPYYENVRILKRINLIGENKNTTVINSKEWIVVNIFSSTDNVIVSGFTITGGHIGVSLDGNNNTIQGNKIVFNTYGIEIIPYEDGNNNVITDNLIVHNSYVGIWSECRDSYNTVSWNVISGNGGSEYDEGGIFNHRPGGIFHHNDFDLNWRYNAYTSWSTWGVWDDGSEGNYWYDWEINPGYPNVYIIEGSFEDQIDYHPSATPYFDYPIVCIDKSSYEAYPNETVHFRSCVNKPISSLSFLWDFGDGNTSNGKNPSHSYSESGIYHIYVTVTDDKGVSDTDRSIAYIGFPPDKPTITGPTNGTIGVWYNYSIVANDSDSDYLHYRIGEGLYNKDIGPYPSGEVVVIDVHWGAVGNHTIRVKAIDDTLFESEWAYFTVYIPRNRMVANTWLLILLERFPLLERLLNLVR